MKKLFLLPALVFTALSAALPAPASAQDADPPMRGGKKVLTIDEYVLWRSIGDASISPDGEWITYAYDHREIDEDDPLDPDRPLVIRRASGADSILVVRGTDPEFSDDGRWIAYFIEPEHDADDDEEPVLELRDLDTGDTRRWEEVDAFGFTEAGVLWAKKNEVDEDAEYDGTDMVIRYLDLGHEELISYVDEFAPDQAGMRLAYTVDGPGGEANGVTVLDFRTRLRAVLDNEREATYARLTWGGDADAEEEPALDALAVLKGEDDDDLVERENALLLWPSVSTVTEPLVLDPRPADEEESGDEGDEESEEEAGDETDEAEEESDEPDDPWQDAWATDAEPAGFPATRVVSEKGGLRWAPDASRIFIETRPQMPAAAELCEEPDDDENGPRVVNLSRRYADDGRPLGPEEMVGRTCPEFIADVNIWHVADDRIQSIQERSVSGDRNRTYTGVVHIDGSDLQYVQLADSTMESVQISDDGYTAIGSDPRPYVSDWRPSYRDYYLLDLETGEREMILEGHLRTLGFDPDGDHFLYWQDAHVWAYDVEAGEHRNVSATTPVSYVNEQFDRLGEKPPHGIAAWTTEGEPIMETRFDLWLQPLDGGEPVNLTAGMGAEQEIEFRLLDLDPDEDLVDTDDPMWLTGYGVWTKQDGFFRAEDGDVETLVWDDARFGRPMKADDADVLMFTRETFETFPDWHLTNTDFDDPVQVTEANPQHDEYNWGRRILFDYYNEEGVRKQGTLAIPHDWEEGEQRPMLVNYYEQNSQNLHSYPTPRNQGSPNFAGYVSDGYLVMQPDIHFRIGASHSDMLESINLAIDVVEEMGYVDPDAIGLHGHSYSGQGNAYISTRSDRFAAIVAGAAATNMVSDFNALWGGSNNAHNYDTYGQGRFGVGLYEDMDLYVDQSAVHHAETMNTPLLLLHGEDDSTVRFMHAVEFYNGLRWLEKNVVLLAYPGEGHGLRQYENQKDFQIRTRQFFDHYLRGAPRAKWMDDGRSYLEK
ncbi:MAG TPA: prolyl oligopeptidase family serine peptidase, partial [Longimicrobiales bacterium]|nr:prolyl oligopeptidase family serine peptidase [Longimicrobiales bacterium]